MGTVYLFTYIIPIEGRTRYRYTLYYTICFLENTVCGLLWYFYADELRNTIVFVPVLVLTIVPYVLGLLLMVFYYMYLHPKVRRSVKDFTVNFKAGGEMTDFSSVVS